MTNRDAGLLTFRALAVYAGILAVEQAERIFRFWPDETETELLGIVYTQIFAPPLLLSVCALILWFISPILARRMFATSEIIESSTVPLADVKSLVFSAIGLLLLIDTIRDLVKTIFLIFTTIAFDTHEKDTLRQRNFLVVVTLLKLGIGSWLFLGTQGLLRVLSRLRRD